MCGTLKPLLAIVTVSLPSVGPSTGFCPARRVTVAPPASRALATAEAQSVRILNDVPGGIETPLVRSRMERVFFNLITNTASDAAAMILRILQISRC